MMKSPLDQIEQKIKELFEHGSIVLPWMDSESVFLHHLTEALHSSVAGGDFSAATPPDTFTIYLCPQDAEFIEGQPNWQEAFHPIINEILLENDLRLEKSPSIRLAKRNSLLATEVRVRANNSDPITGQTNAVPIKVEKRADSGTQPATQACLLLEDESIFWLKNTAINIGRKSGNHLIIDDLRVSRNHAQIRNIESGFMIFDTGSTGGTYVNGERITQRLLKVGDVISLAGVKLIFTQEAAAPSDEEVKQITSEMNTKA